MEFREQTLAESPLRQLFWGLAYLALGWVALWQGKGWLMAVAGLALLGLGLFVLRHLVTKVTVLLVKTGQATGPISLGHRLTTQEEAEVRERLRVLGFPI